MTRNAHEILVSGAAYDIAADEEFTSAERTVIARFLQHGFDGHSLNVASIQLDARWPIGSDSAGVAFHCYDNDAQTFEWQAVLLYECANLAQLGGIALIDGTPEFIPRTYRTKTGRVLTDSDIEELADEAERGYDVKHLKGGTK